MKILAAGLTAICGSTPAMAVPVTWYISGTTYKWESYYRDGNDPVIGPAEGRFTFDVDTGDVTNVDVEIGGDTYTYGEKKNNIFGSNTSFMFFRNADSAGVGDGAIWLSSSLKFSNTPRTLDLVPSLFEGGYPVNGVVLIQEICTRDPCHGGTPGEYYVLGTLSGEYGPPAPEQPAEKTFAVLDAQTEGEAPEFTQYVEIPLTVEDPIGVVAAVNGPATVTRTTGETVPLSVGMEIALGDVVETDAGGLADLSFADDTSLVLSENGRLEIDEYVYDPDIDTGEAKFSTIRRVFEWSAGLVKERENEVQGSLGGPRGDATPFVKQDLLENPEPLFGNVGIWAETASPVGVSTIVNVPDGAFNLSFDYAFFGDEAFFEVLLGDVVLFDRSFTSSDSGFPHFFSSSFEFMNGNFLTDLVFRMDGDEGQSFLLQNIVFNGQRLQNFSDFERFGTGPVFNVLVGTQAQLDTLEAAMELEAPSQVPLPASLLLLGSPLFLLFGLRRRVPSSM